MALAHDVIVVMLERSHGKHMSRTNVFLIVCFHHMGLETLTNHPYFTWKLGIYSPIIGYPQRDRGFGLTSPGKWGHYHMLYSVGSREVQVSSPTQSDSR